ncbi:hypothetical protein WOLCODRAFT_157236 [Wolfiporia cocos MD-104 SS10]|uniref:Uncharacterized protein n=1 Tax=Wolfiporia cocos (strain MD-104) TaxID=742152 RepID=A0A2H3J9Q0_WOLCO|nr:hypothetical protein WOLCODRAFT_157236 [Wolfiporia cocos MD-104 SS10]
MPRAARFTVKPKNAASGVREEWDICSTQALEDRISNVVAPRAKKSRKGNAAKRVEEERAAWTLQQRIAKPPAKSLLDRVEELRMPAEWVEARGLSNPKDVHCTEKKWDWFLEIQKKMVNAHPAIYQLARADNYLSPPAILTRFTLLTTDFDDLCANLEHRVRQDKMQNKEMRLLEKYLKQMEHIFGDLEVDKHTTQEMVIARGHASKAKNTSSEE